MMNWNRAYRRDMDPKQAIALFASVVACVMLARVLHGTRETAPEAGLQPLLRQPGCPSASAVLLATLVNHTAAGEPCTMR